VNQVSSSHLQQMSVVVVVNKSDNVGCLVVERVHLSLAFIYCPGAQTGGVTLTAF